jgi:hypothetical protein
MTCGEPIPVVDDENKRDGPIADRGDWPLPASSPSSLGSGTVRAPIAPAVNTTSRFGSRDPQRQDKQHEADADTEEAQALYGAFLPYRRRSEPQERSTAALTNTQS